MLSIIVETNYKNNKRFTGFLSGVKSVADKRKIPIKVYARPEEVDKACKVLIVVGASLQWTRSVINYFSELDVHLILFGFSNLENLSGCSFISQKYADTMHKLVSALLKTCTDKIAFIGYNPDSLPDYQKLYGAKQAAAEHNVPLDVFFNYGNMRDCLNKFLPRKKEYKNLVCVNDMVAILLCNALEDVSGYNISGYDSLYITKFLRYSFLSTVIDYFKAGKIVAEFYNYLFKSANICEMTVALTSELVFRGEIIEDDCGQTVNANNIETLHIDFYGDKPVALVEKIDNIFRDADDIDIRILKGLLHGETYEAIAEKNFMALNTVKYRINKMKSIFGEVSKAEFISILRNFGIEI